MTIVRMFLAVTIALSAAGLSGCGGYPMTVESRTAASGPKTLTTRDRILINKQKSRSRASGM